MLLALVEAASQAGAAMQVSCDKAFLSKQGGGGRERSRGGPSMGWEDPADFAAAEQLSAMHQA